MPSCIKIINKKYKYVPKEKEIIVNVDRGNPLGNPFVLKNKYDLNERVSAISKYSKLLEEDFQNEGKMFKNVLGLTDMVLRGYTPILACWCKEPDLEVPCHADVINQKVEEIINEIDKN